MMTLMANMLSPNEESRMREKRGKEELTQAINMIMVVSIIFLPYKIFLSVVYSFLIILLS